MTKMQTMTMTALAALMLCSACTSQNTQTATATLISPASQQLAVLKWDEAVAASTTVKVNNSNLISMR